MKVIVMNNKAYKQLEKLFTDLIFKKIDEIIIDPEQILDLSNHIYSYTAHFDDVDNLRYEEEENENDN